MGYIGIDFGTCFSNAAIIENNQIIPLKVDGDDTKLASALFLENNNKFSIGKTAISNRIKDLRKFKKEFKRDFGETKPFNIGNKNYLPEELCTEVLKYIKIKAEERLSENVNNVVITCPAKWSGYKKGLLEKATFMAGFTDITLLDEPTAAAIYYAQDENISDGEKILVYDLGGGTFDIALIHKTKDGFKQIAQAKGIERCGGIDFDKKILRNIKEKFKDNEAFNTMIASEFRFQLFLENEAIKLKHILSEQNEAMASIPIGFEYLDYHITREEFNSLIEEDIAKTCSLIKDIVNEANLKYEDIDRVILVGGSTRIPYVQEMIEKTVENKIPIFKNIDPDLAVCCGAVWKAKSEFNKDDNYYINLGLDSQVNGFYNEAIEYYKKAIEINPKNIEAYKKIGDCYDYNNQEDESIKYYKKAIEIDPNYKDAYNNIGLFYSKQKQYDKAMKYYKKAIEIDPNYKGAYYNIGLCYSKQKQYDKAVVYYKKVIKIDSYHKDAYNNIGNCYYNKSSYNKAIEYYNKVIEIDPNYKNAYNNMTQCYYMQDLYDRAIEYYNKLIEIDPNHNNSNTYNCLAHCHRELNNLSEAIKYYLKSIQINSDNEKVFASLGYCYKLQYDYNKAIENYKKCTEISPNPFMYNEIAGCYKNLNKFEEAIKWCKKAIELSPEYVEAYRNIGLCYINQKKYDEAIEWNQKALNINPDYLDSYLYIGICYENKAELIKAKEYYNKAIEKDSECADAYFNLADCYRYEADYETALDFYKKTLEIDPNYSDINKNIELCYQSIPDYEPIYLRDINSFYKKFGISDKNNNNELYNQIYKIYEIIPETGYTTAWDNLCKSYKKLLELTCMNDCSNKQSKLIKLTKEFKNYYTLNSYLNWYRLGGVYCNLIVKHYDEAITAIILYLDLFRPDSKYYYEYKNDYFISDILKDTLNKDYIGLIAELTNSYNKASEELNKLKSQNKQIEFNNGMKKLGMGALTVGGSIAASFVFGPAALLGLSLAGKEVDNVGNESLIELDDSLLEKIKNQINNVEREFGIKIRNLQIELIKLKAKEITN